MLCLDSASVFMSDDLVFAAATQGIPLNLLALEAGRVVGHLDSEVPYNYNNRENS